MEKKFCDKINHEVELLARKYAKDNEILYFNLVHDLDSLANLAIQQFRSAMNIGKESYAPEKIQHG
jgi:hypothetical protein